MFSCGFSPLSSSTFIERIDVVDIALSILPTSASTSFKSLASTEDEVAEDDRAGIGSTWGLSSMRTFLLEVPFEVVEVVGDLGPWGFPPTVADEAWSPLTGGFLCGHSFAEWFLPPHARHRPTFSMPSHECMNGQRAARAHPLYVFPKNLQGTLDRSSWFLSLCSPSDLVVDAEGDLDPFAVAAFGVVVGVVLGLSGLIGFIFGSGLVGTIAVEEVEAATIDAEEIASVSHSARR